MQTKYIIEVMQNVTLEVTWIRDCTRNSTKNKVYLFSGILYVNGIPLQVINRLKYKEYKSGNYLKQHLNSLSTTEKTTSPAGTKVLFALAWFPNTDRSQKNGLYNQFLTNCGNTLSKMIEETTILSTPSTS